MARGAGVTVAVVRADGPDDGSGLLARLRRTLELVAVLGPRELRVRYRQSVLDVTWALLSPIAILVVYGLVLTQSFDVTTTCGPYLSNAWIGLVIWTFFATSLGTGVASIISSASEVTTRWSSSLSSGLPGTTAFEV